MRESWNSIKCPFCFKRFAHNEVHFRIAEGACAEANEKMEQASSDEEKQKYKKFVIRDTIDPKYEKVWGKLRGGTPPENVERLFYVPWVDENNKHEMINGDYILDEDGFVESIEDQCAHLSSHTRICPHCHNELPQYYGKNPQKFIAILGVSASGKTVFIKQLLERFGSSTQEGILNHVDGSCIGLTLPEDDNSYITLGQPLPDSTRDLNFKIPYFVTMNFKKNNIVTTYDFVIYDVAGETLVNTDLNKFNFFAGYIKESDAIITLIDPMQLVRNPKPEYPAGEMIKTLYTVFGEQVKVPMAIAVSKSDLLISNPLIRETLNPDGMYFNEHSMITKNIPWDPEKKYFYADVYSMLNSQLKKFLKNVVAQFYSDVENNAQNATFFAVSALFDGVDQKLTFELSSKEKWKSDNIQKYIEKFSILKNKLKDIQYDLEDQEANPDENIIDTNNIIVDRTFVFDQSDEMVRKLDSILGQVSMLSTRAEIRDAVFEQFSEDEKIELIASDKRGDEILSARELIKYIGYLNEEMEDCMFDMYMQGYPRSNGDLKSLRIEEPFFWILSELDIIGRGDRYEQKQSEPKPRSWSWKFWGKGKNKR